MSISVKLSSVISPWYICKSQSDKFKNNNYSENTGLGNNLFQLSAILSLSWDNNVELYAPDVEIICKKENIDKKDTIYRNINTNKIKIKKNIHIEGRQISNNYKYFPNTCYMGYMENFKYFHHHQEKIREIFSPNENDLKYINSKYKKYLDKNNCAIHIRHGKDKSLNYQKNDEKIKYYDKSINDMKNRVDLFLIFTDNIKWSKQLLNEKRHPGINFILIRERDFIDLWIISLCDNLISSCSTFSWWAGYLNKNPNKIIISEGKKSHRGLWDNFKKKYV